MKINKFKYEAPIGMFLKKHYCPECSTILKTKKVKRVVNSESEEAKGFDFSAGDGPELVGGRLVGDVEFTWYVYYCDNCNIEITNKDMRRHENEMQFQNC